ncbi:hypothetical protein B0H21DRAFT_884982 [Amylocystis lapponica]|nr:hypothetical protein B0H21DRAFT_884982 [Amylocystis lapponica]
MCRTACRQHAFLDTAGLPFRHLAVWHLSYPLNGSGSTSVRLSLQCLSSMLHSPAARRLLIRICASESEALLARWRLPMNLTQRHPEYLDSLPPLWSRDGPARSVILAFGSLNVRIGVSLRAFALVGLYGCYSLISREQAKTVMQILLQTEELTSITVNRKADHSRLFRQPPLISEATLTQHIQSSMQKHKGPFYGRWYDGVCPSWNLRDESSALYEQD